VRKHANGHRHFLSIGECGTGGLTVTAARKQAGDHVAAIRNGLSPSEQRAKMRAVPTVNAFADTWLEAHVDAKLKSSTAQLYRVILRTVVLPALGKLRVDQVTEEHVECMHRAAAKTPYNVNRAVAIVSSLMKFAERRKLRGAHSNPARGLERYREDKRERFLSREEIIRLGSALTDPVITAKHSPFALAAIGLLLLTGMRRNEVLKLRLKEVDQERRLLLLDDSKTGKKAVVLSEHAARLIPAHGRNDRSPDCGRPGSQSLPQPTYRDCAFTICVTRSPASRQLRAHHCR
jgi:integrase